MTMKTISAVLTVGATGSDAANLIEAVIFLVERRAIKTYESPQRPTAEDLHKLTQAAREELAKATFGPATRMLIEFLQVQGELRDARRGVVDQPTASVLNQLLTERGALQRHVTGSVRSVQRYPVGGMLVQLYEQQLSQPTLLRESKTDE